MHFPWLLRLLFPLRLAINAVITTLNIWLTAKIHPSCLFPKLSWLVVVYPKTNVHMISFYFPQKLIPQVPPSLLCYLIGSSWCLAAVICPTISCTAMTTSSAEGSQEGRLWRRLDWKQVKEKGNWNTKLRLRLSDHYWLIKPDALKGAPLELWQSVVWGVQMTISFIQLQQAPEAAQKSACINKVHIRTPD